MLSNYCTNSSASNDKAYETSFHSASETMPRVEAEGSSRDVMPPPLEPCDTPTPPAIEPVCQVVTIPNVQTAIHNADIPAIGKRSPSISDASFDTGKAVKVLPVGDSSNDAVINKKVSFHGEADDEAATHDPSNEEVGAEVGNGPGSTSRSGFDANVPIVPSTHTPFASKNKEGVLRKILRLLGVKHGTSGGN